MFLKTIVYGNIYKILKTAYLEQASLFLLTAK